MRKPTVPPSMKILAVAIAFPILTGFSNEQPQPQGVPFSNSAIEYQAKTSPAATSPVATPAAATSAAMTSGAGSGEATPSAAGDNDTGRGVVHSWETGAGKSYAVPAIEVPSFLLLMNIFDRIVYSGEDKNGKGEYDTNLHTTWDHLRKQNWGYDKDPFNVNQFAHPYEGATMFGLARSCGLSFWESWVYSNVGSFIWEMAGETTRPSINDMITTGNSGSLLGEALFRMSALVLSHTETPETWRKVGAGIVSPTTAFNRLVFGERFKAVFPSRDPATFWRFRLGVALNSQNDAAADFGMSYGLPGKPGYRYDRPLDYFDFQISGLSSSDNPVGNVLLRGLLLGKTYEAGENYRGIWGIYGSYDYIAPTIFRVSTTAVSLGTTGQYWIAPGVALQGSVLGGIGFGGAGVTPVRNEDRDYHYGVTPQGIMSTRLIFGTRVAWENVVRGYFVSGTGSDYSEGSESILRFNSNVILRIFRRHGLGLQFIEAVRHAQYGNLPSKHQSEGTFGIFYTFLGDSHFGAVDWRNQGDR